MNKRDYTKYIEFYLAINSPFRPTTPDYSKTLGRDTGGDQITLSVLHYE